MTWSKSDTSRIIAISLLSTLPFLPLSVPYFELLSLCLTHSLLLLFGFQILFSIKNDSHVIKRERITICNSKRTINTTSNIIIRDIMRSDFERISRLAFWKPDILMLPIFQDSHKGLENEVKISTFRNKPIWTENTCKTSVEV